MITTTISSIRIGLACMLACVGLAQPLHASEADATTTFAAFCVEQFGAEKEPLVYQLFGEDLQILPEGVWIHGSATSAVVGWDTNLPARSWVEYGTDASYGRRTPEPDRHFYVHVRQLRDLEPDTTYHYRLVSVDERGNEVASADRTFTTARPEGAIAIPGDLGAPPYTLDQDGATYLVTEDIVCDASAFVVTGQGITLDLGGHVVTYNQQPVTVSTDHWKTYLAESAFGVLMRGSDIRVVNGHIRQGAGDNGSSKISIGSSPIHGEGADGHIEVAGVELTWGGDQMIGLNNHWCDGTLEVHHCVFNDRGTEIRNRHGGACRSMRSAEKQTATIHHNLVTRTRQMGLTGGQDLFNNEIYVDSFSTNSFAATVGKVGGRGHHNRIFATGFNPYGFGWGERDWKVHDNLIHMVGQDVSERWGERWGDVNMLAGMRVTNYGKGGQERDGLEYENNVIVITGSDDCEIRGVEFFSDNSIKGLDFHDNVVKVAGLDEATNRVACVDAQGHFRKEDSIPVLYRNNTFISNRHHVRFGDDYGKGLYHHFIDCHFVKSGDHPDFSTFYFGGAFWNYGHVIRDCTFEGGAAADDVRWGRIGGDKSWYRIEWTLTVEAPAGAEVRIVDATGEAVHTATVAGDDGVALPLVEAVLTTPEGHNWSDYEEGRGGMLGAQRSAHTPHRVSVTLGERTVEAEVDMTTRRHLRLAGDKLVPVAAGNEG